jgi:hypothetical protein
MRKHLVGVAVLTIIAFAFRFAQFLPTVDIYTHDRYIVIVPRVFGFWILLAIAALWLVVAASKFRQRSS